MIKQKYIKAPILKSPNWEVEFHVHTNASLLVIGVLPGYPKTQKHDQLVMYASRLLNNVKRNYST